MASDASLRNHSHASDIEILCACVVAERFAEPTELAIPS
jgi:hypothetical protein